MSFLSLHQRSSTTPNEHSSYDNADELESISLAISVLAGDTNRVQALVGIGVCLSDSHHWVLYEACLQGLDMLQALVAGRSVMLNTIIPDAQGDCLLHFILRTPASRFSSDKTTIVKTLLDNGTKPYSQDRHGDNALHILAGMCSEDHELLTLFLGPNSLANLDVRNRYNDTPLIVAVIYDYYYAASLLLRHGADPHVKGEMGQSAMDFALQRGNADMVDLLLVFGASLDGTGAMLVDPKSPCVDTEMDLGVDNDTWCDVATYCNMGEDNKDERGQDDGQVGESISDVGESISEQFEII